MKNKQNAILALYCKEFKTTRKSFIIWCSVIAGVMFLNMIVFGLVKEMADLVIMEGMEGMEGMDIFGAMINFNYYFGIQYDGISMILCGGGMIFGANVFHKEETSGSIEFLYSLNVSRLDIYISKVAYVTTKLFSIASAALLVSIISGCIVGLDTLNVGMMISGWLIALLGTFFFASLGYLLASLLGRKKSVTGICVGFTAITYVLGVLGTVGLEKIAFLEYFSPIHIMSAGKVIYSDWGIGVESYPIAGFLVIAVLTIGLTIGSYFIYNKKDLQ